MRLASISFLFGVFVSCAAGVLSASDAQAQSVNDTWGPLNTPKVLSRINYGSNATDAPCIGEYCSLAFPPVEAGFVLRIDGVSCRIEIHYPTESSDRGIFSIVIGLPRQKQKDNDRYFFPARYYLAPSPLGRGDLEHALAYEAWQSRDSMRVFFEAGDVPNIGIRTASSDNILMHCFMDGVVQRK
jgi:hypothetical protein